MTTRPTYHAERLKTDKDGRLTAQVKGTQNLDMKGYLAAWVPDTQAQE
jgi:dextransucrase